MTKLAGGRKKQVSHDLSILTYGLTFFGFILFYFIGQALTAEDAHPVHWGLAVAGAVAGWLAGVIIERLR